MDSCTRENGFVVAVNTVKESIVEVRTVAHNIADVQNVSENMADVNNVSLNMAEVQNVSLNMLDVGIVSQNIADVQNVSENMADVNNVSLNMAEVIAAVPAAQDAAATYTLVQAEAIEVANDMSYVAQTAAMLFAVAALGMGVIVDASGHLLVTLADMTNIESLSIDNNGHLMATYTV